jgi:hypothetical protein
MSKRLAGAIGAGLLAAVALAGGAVAPVHASPGCTNNLALNTATGATTPAPLPRDTVLATHPSIHPFPDCTVPQSAVDLRLLAPGTTHVSPSLVADFGAGVPSLTARLTGMGFNNTAVTMTRTAVTGGAIYSAGWAAVPTGPTTANAVISVTVVNSAGAVVASGTWRSN